MRGRALSIWLLLAVSTAGCGHKEDPVQCGDELLIDIEADFGDVELADIQPLIDRNCRRCHDSSRSGERRNGAPAGVNFDVEAAVLTFTTEIVQRASSGTMPPDRPLSLRDKCIFYAYGQFASGAAEESGP
jgi:uncharacterized membrane protein